MPIRLIYLVHHELLSSVFESMVLRHLEALRRQGHDVWLVTTLPIGWLLRRGPRGRARERLRVARETLGGQVRYLLTPPKRWASRFDVSSRVVSAVGRIAAGHDDVPWIVQCRGPRSTRMGLQCRSAFGRDRIRVLADPRGIAWAEHAYDANPGVWPLLDEVPAALASGCDAEAELYQQADSIIAVSGGMKQFYERMSNRRMPAIEILPNGVDIQPYGAAMQRRDALRAELGLSRRFVLAYCGSVYPRQRIPAALELIGTLVAAFDRLHFLILTGSEARFREALGRSALDPARYTLLSVPHDETPRHLAAADAGLIATGLFERDHLANQACCPVKFAEYLAAGLPVVLSEGIGDCSALIARSGLGHVVGHEDSIEVAARGCLALFERIEQQQSRLRADCRALARVQFSMEHHCGLFLGLCERVRARQLPGSSATGC